MAVKKDCYHCNGYGKIKVYYPLMGFYYDPCPKCKGSGKVVGFLERIFGKNNK